MIILRSRYLKSYLDNNVPLEIVLSNHTADFIRAYETQNNYLPNNLAEHFVKSMFGLNQLIDRDLVSKKDIDTLFEKIYTTNLKALTYTINEKNQSIAVFSHAPIGLETIESLCQKLNITYCDDSLEELAQND